MNSIEQNLILYYSDFLSLKATSKPITDNCKYYFIHGCPINVSFLVNTKPFFDVQNPFYLQSLVELQTIRNKFGEEGIMSFLEDICMLRVTGAVSAKLMLKYIHRHSSKDERKRAFTTYYKWLDNQKYVKVIETEDGKYKEIECSRYIAHVERDCKDKRVYYSCRMDIA